MPVIEKTQTIAGEQVTSEEMAELIIVHRNRYRNRIASRQRNVNVAECIHYRDLWESILRKQGDVSKLAPDEIQELTDAIASGELEEIREYKAKHPEGFEEDNGRV